MGPERETESLKDLRFAAELRRQFEGLAAATSPARGSVVTRTAAVTNSHRWAMGGVVAAAVVLGLLLIGVPGVSRVSGPPPVSAAQVIQKMLHALASGGTLQADSLDRLRVGADTYVVRHARVLLRSDGSVRFTQTDKPEVSRPEWARDRYDANVFAYDSEHGVYRDYVRGWDPDTGPSGAYLNQVVVTKGYPLGPPDAAPVFAYDFSAVARALQAGAEASLRTTTYQGRPAWVISISDRVAIGSQLAGVAAARWAGASGDEVAATTVDQETCLPMRFQVLVGGVVQFEYRWTNVRVNEPLPDRAFAFAPPKSAKVVHKDGGFRRVPLSAIASATGREPLLPAWLPSGYTQRWAAIAATSTTANGATRGRDVVAVQYARGFDGLTVTTRTVDDPRHAAEVDPVEDEIWWADLLSKHVRLTKGSFAGATAQFVLGPQISIPHLWVVKDGVMLTVAGGVTAGELVRIAESMRPVSG